MLQALCRYAEGTNSVTGVDTRKSLGECLPKKPAPPSCQSFDSCSGLGKAGKACLIAQSKRCEQHLQGAGHMLSSTGPVEVCTPYEFLCCFSKSVRGLSHFCQVDEREKDAFRKTMPIYRQ